MFDTLENNLQLREDYKGKYIWGTVVDDADPENRDRIKARVPGLYNPDEGDVPWIGPAKSSPFGISGEWGCYGAACVGSDVLILLQEGDSHYPIYIAAIQRRANPEFTSGTHWGFKDPKGNRLRVNVKTGEINFNAPAGLQITLTASGDLNVSVSGSVNMDVAGSVNLAAPEFNINGDVNTNGALTNNGIDVGSGHLHSGVVIGAANTGAPV